MESCCATSILPTQPTWVASPPVVPGTVSSRGIYRGVSAEDQPRRRNAGTSSDEHMLEGVDLVDRRSAQLADAFSSAVHAVDIGLTQLAAVHSDYYPVTGGGKPTGR